MKTRTPSIEEIERSSREIARKIVITPTKSIERQLEETERVIALLIAGGFVTKEKVAQARALAESLKP